MEELTILEPGKRLKKARKKLGLTQQDLAGENMSKNYVSMFENGKRHISIINATYFAEVLNNKAKEKGIDINFEASYFIKNEKDMAREKSTNWLKQISNQKELNKAHIYKELYKIIYISEKYELNDLLAIAYKTKGKYLHRDGLYICAITHFSKSLLFYIKEDDNIGIKNIYIAIGKSYFMNEDYQMSIVYYNLAGLIQNEDNILYYRALSYSKLGQYEIAKDICNRIMFKDERVIELENYLSNTN